MPRYRADFTAVGSCYVDAVDADAALAKARSLVGLDGEIQIGARDIVIDGDGSFLSPVMTPTEDITGVELMDA